MAWATAWLLTLLPGPATGSLTAFESAFGTAEGYWKVSGSSSTWRSAFGTAEACLSAAAVMPFPWAWTFESV
jgi:hypothetical protein